MAGKTEKYSLQGVDVEVVRKGAGRPLLLLHGGGGSVASQPFVDKLAEKFEVIAPTHPGFNGTKVPDHFDDMGDLVFLYLDLIEALKLEDAVLLGISMGGWLAAELAVLPGLPFSRLILVDAVGVKIGGPTDRDIADIFSLPPQEQAAIMWHDPSKAPSLENASDEVFEGLAANRIALALYTWEPYMHNPKLKHRLHRVKVPSLLIWGASDKLVTPAYGEAYTKLIPGAKFVTIPEAGHSPQSEQPDAFVAQVFGFTD